MPTLALVYESYETKIKFILFLKERRELNGKAWTPYIDGEIKQAITKPYPCDIKDTHTRTLEILHYPKNYVRFEWLN